MGKTIVSWVSRCEGMDSSFSLTIEERAVDNLLNANL